LRAAAGMAAGTNRIPVNLRSRKKDTSPSRLAQQVSIKIAHQSAQTDRVDYCYNHHGRLVAGTAGLGTI